MRHKAKIINQKIRFTRPNTWMSNIKILDGKEVYVTLEEIKENISSNQYAFYFGVILKQTLNFNTFAGWTEEELHGLLLRECGGYKKAIMNDKGNVKKLVTVPGDFERMKNDKKVMASYINKVIHFLWEEERITFGDPSNYKLNKHIGYEKKRKQ